MNLLKVLGLLFYKLTTKLVLFIMVNNIRMFDLQHKDDMKMRVNSQTI